MAVINVLFCRMKGLQQKILLLMIVLITIPAILFAQILTGTTQAKSDAVKITNKQTLQFGVFASGTGGGKIIIAADGARSVTGTVTPLNFGMNYSAAILEIEAPAGSIISFINGPDAVLTGSNGGTMSMQIGRSNPPGPIYITNGSPAKTELDIGGILTVGNTVTSPPGNYSGSFYISFILE
ncbi:MAG: DUF4402 domain-containing protein [Ferruginibacter sp.]